MSSKWGKPPETLQRVQRRIRPGLVVEVRTQQVGCFAVRLPRKAHWAAGEHDPNPGGVNDDRLVARRVTRRRQQTHPLGDLFVARDEPNPIVRNMCPLRHRVAICLRRHLLFGLYVHRCSEKSELAAVVEMEVGDDHCGDEFASEPDSAKSLRQRDDLGLACRFLDK